MLLLYKKTDGDYDDEDYYMILHYPDELKINYKWLNYKLDIIAELSLAYTCPKYIKIVELHELFNVYDFTMARIYVHVPKEVLLYLINVWKNDKIKESFWKNEIKYIEDNIDIIYDELMIKDIIE